MRQSGQEGTPPRFLVRAPGRVETEGKLGKDGVSGGAQMWAC